LKNGFAAAQKSFPPGRWPDVIMTHAEPLRSSLERRKTFDSPLANHFSAVLQPFVFWMEEVLNVTAETATARAARA
jgi:hypothetical protein